MEECHKMLTDQIDWVNPEGSQVRIDISRPLPLSGPPGHVTIQTQFFYNKDLDYLRYGSKGCEQALSISKMKAARYHDFGLELLVPEHMWINNVCTYDISASYAYSRYGYDYLKEITLRRADYQEYTIGEKDFKNLYPSDFEDLNLLLLQGYLNHLSGSDKRMLFTAVNFNNERKIMRFNEIYKFSDGTLTNILEALHYRVKEYKVNRFNPGMNTRFWTDKDVARSKEFIHAIKRRLKTRRIFQNLECFVGGRVRDIDYRLLQRTELAHHICIQLGDCDVHSLEDLTLILEILSRRFFLRLNLPDHRFNSSISFKASVTLVSKSSQSDQVLKLKGTSRTMNNQAFTIKKGMSMLVQMSQAQDNERPQTDDQRLDLADDLKEAQDHISHLITSHKTKITTSKYKILHEESKTTS
ncbi:hypothetical protein Tco_1549254 [Tanacetum coccineum]